MALDDARAMSHPFIVIIIVIIINAQDLRFGAVILIKCGLKTQM
ncbi:MAG: hypothetical protein ACK4K8_16800 [Pannonibacter sp.]